MKWKKWIRVAIVSLTLTTMLGGCGMSSKSREFKEAVKNHLEEKYGEEFEILKWRQPKLLPSDNGAIYVTCIAKNDPLHPFEGVYYYTEEHGLEEEEDRYIDRLLAKQMEERAEKVVSQIAGEYYIQGDVYIPSEWRSILTGKDVRLEEYRDLCNSTEDRTKYTMGAIYIYIDVETMNGRTDDEEYAMYEKLCREEIGGEVIMHSHYMDSEHYQAARKILEESAPKRGGSQLSDARENQPYFGTIMRKGSEIFDDSLEIFKAAKRGEEQEKYKRGTGGGQKKHKRGTGETQKYRREGE